MPIFPRPRHGALCFAAGLALLVVPPPAFAQAPKEITITYRNKHFSPADVSAPGNTPLVIRIKNIDPDPMEFESETLHFEQIINGKGEATINLQPLKPGKYGFFDDYHATSEGNLIVK